MGRAAGRGRSKTPSARADERTPGAKHERGIPEYSGRIHLYNEDAVILTQQLTKTLPENSIFYFDPPYYVKGKVLYLNYYNDDDHKNIANMILPFDIETTKQINIDEY